MKKISTLFCMALMALMMPISAYGQQSRVLLSFQDAAGGTVTQATATLGEDFTEPTLVIEPANAGVRVAYSSSNPSIATVDMMSGEVTLVAAGTTNIIAQSGQTEQYFSGRASYQLTVQSATPPTPACPDAHFYLNGAQITSLTLHVGESVSVPMLMSATGSLISGQVRVESPTIAMVSADNMIHGLAQGNTTLHVLMAMGEGGDVLTCDYSLALVVEAAVPQKQSPELSWSDTVVYAELGVPCAAPVLNNPHNVPLNKIESQNPAVASISEDGTVLTINGVGDALIFAESFDTQDYYAQSVSYMVHVSTIGLRVKGINVTSLNAADVLGDGSHNVTFEKETRTLHLSSWNIDGTELTGLNAMIEDDGMEHPLTIKLHGVNAITNIPTCIKAEHVPVVIMGQSMRDALSLSASQIAVNTTYFKIHQCSVDATTPTMAAIKLGNELGVSKNSHLYATSTTGLAIQCKTLVMAEGEEGVAILTPGIRFEMNKGFLDANNQYAKAVEIGKVPVVVPNDEVTTIDFTATDPEGNETIVFSASTNDAFNAESGQLELSTSLTDEVVANALENLVPGSSAWLNLLPGSLVFDIPAGQGTIRVQCLTLMGYTLQVKMEGNAVVSIAQTQLGWAEVTYNVPAPIHVVIYLHATSSNPAPARIPTRMEDAITPAACIQAIQIVPDDAPTAIENAVKETAGTQKVMLNGIMYIIREGKAYNAQGTLVK